MNHNSLSAIWANNSRQIGLGSKCNLFGILCTVILLIVSVSTVTAEPYKYTNPYKATVYGTPLKQRYVFTGHKAPFKERSLIAANRNIPEIFHYSAKMRYLTAMQMKEAPLIFLIAGTGGAYDSEKNMFLGQLFWEAGYHVVTLSSPTHINFLISMSKHGISGYVPYDVSDLYRVMNVIKGEVEKTHRVTDYTVAGYSLGGLHSAFLAHMDEQRQQLGISRAVMINPPVSLFDSILRLDSYLTPENLNGKTVKEEVERFVEEFSSLYLSVYSSGFDDDFLYGLANKVDFSDEDLQSLVGISFRMTSASMLFTSDVLLNAGYVVPDANKLTSKSSLMPYGRTAFSISFEDYADEFLLPYVLFNDNSLDRATVLAQSSLYSIENYLKESQKVYVIGTEDDPILSKDEVAFLKETLGERSFFFAAGGHCGNMMYAPFAKKLQGMVKP